MIETTAITFFINDVEFEDTYEYTAYFFEESEVGHFIEDNEKVGNDIRILDVKILTEEEFREMLRYGHFEEAVEHYLKNA